MKEEDVVVGNCIILTWGEKHKEVVVLRECEYDNNRGEKLFYVSGEVHPFHPKYFEVFDGIKIFDIEI